MKYPEEMYLNSYNNFYAGDMDGEEVQLYKEKIVKCRKDRICSSCQKTINKGEQALRESGFLYGESVSSYTCLECIENWLEESGQVDAEEDD